MRNITTILEAWRRGCEGSSERIDVEGLKRPGLTKGVGCEAKLETFELRRGEIGATVTSLIWCPQPGKLGTWAWALREQFVSVPSRCRRVKRCKGSVSWDGQSVHMAVLILDFLGRRRHAGK